MIKITNTLISNTLSISPKNQQIEIFLQILINSTYIKKNNNNKPAID